MTKPRVGRRDFLRDVAGSAAAMSILPRTASAQAPARTGQSEAEVRGHRHQPRAHQQPGRTPCCAAAASWSRCIAKEPDLVAAFVKRFPQAKRARSEKEILEDPSIQLVLSSGDPGRARAARHPRDAARQGLHVRQAGHHDARAARRSAQGAGGDQAHLLDHVQRAAREPRDGQGGRAGEGRRDRPGDPDDRARPHRITPATRPEWFWDKAQFGGILCDIAFPPGRPVPLLHRLDARRRRRVAGRQRPPLRSARSSRISAT